MEMEVLRMANRDAEPDQDPESKTSFVQTA